MRFHPTDDIIGRQTAEEEEDPLRDFRPSDTAVKVNQLSKTFLQKLWCWSRKDCGVGIKTCIKMDRRVFLMPDCSQPQPYIGATPADIDVADF